MEKLVFSKINDGDDISHLMYRNKQDIGSRLDLGAVSVAASSRLVKGSQAVRWTTLDTLLKGNPKAAEIKQYIKETSDNISDHMPVVTRFYFTNEH